MLFRSVLGIQDIIEELSLPCAVPLQEDRSKQTETELSKDEQKILAMLSHEPTHVDKIIKGSTLETASAHASLALLELKGCVRNVGGMRYTLS